VAHILEGSVRKARYPVLAAGNAFQLQHTPGLHRPGVTAMCLMHPLDLGP
jgi:hypothetical protein